MSKRNKEVEGDVMFTPKEMDVIYLFVDKGKRRDSYKQIFGKDVPSDRTIYRWFLKPEVQAKIVEIGNQLGIYDTVCDKILLSVITDEETFARDKIAAIKVWNDLRQRVHTNIKVSVEDKIDFSNVSSKNLESVVEAIMKGSGNEST